MENLKRSEDSKIMFSIDTFRSIYPEQLWLSITDSYNQIKLSNKDYSNDAASWNAYINSISLTIFKDWYESDSNSKLDVFPCNISSVWEFVTGFAVQIGKIRLVLIPNEFRDTQEFSVPQEWVDIPEWVAHYYIAVQINLTDNYLRIWGYTSHDVLKNQGEYDKFERMYLLDGEDLLTDLNSLWVTQELDSENLKPIKAINSSSDLSSEIAKQIIENYSHPSPYSPRLDISFDDWSCLLQNNDWRQKFYQERLKQANVRHQTFVQLSSWLKSNVLHLHEGWQDFEHFIRIKQPQLYYMRSQAGNLRHGNSRFQPDDIESIKNQIEILKAYRNEDKSRQTTERLIDNLLFYLQNHKDKQQMKSLTDDAVKALIQVMRTTEYEDTRWTIAENLWMLDPENQNVGKRKIKDLGMQLAGYAISLMISILEKADQTMAVLLRIYPMSQACLPESLKFTVLDEDNETFLEAESRGRDNFIQLTFSGSKGDKFGVKIAISQASFYESFVI